MESNTAGQKTSFSGLAHIGHEEDTDTAIVRHGITCGNIAVFVRSKKQQNKELNSGGARHDGEPAGPVTLHAILEWPHLCLTADS